LALFDFVAKVALSLTIACPITKTFNPPSLQKELNHRLSIRYRP
jgi:hypothetical protein